MKRKLATLAIFVFLAHLLSCRDANRWIKKLGFQPITPPSNLLAPGAVVMRKHGFGSVRLLCTAEESLGADFKASQSRTIGGRFSRGKQVGWKISGDALKQVKIAANSDAVESIHVKVSNARIENLTDTDVLLAVPQRSAACDAAMRRRKDQGYELSLITRCLRADVSYGIQFKDDANVDVKAKLANLQAVNVSLGGTFQSTGDSSAQASNLIWGAADDVWLAKISSRDADVVALRGQSPVHSKRQSLFLPEESLTASKGTQTPDDDADGPTWGVEAESALSEPIPGADDAMSEAVQDAPADESSTDGYVPTEGGAPESADAAQDPGVPISPRAR